MPNSFLEISQKYKHCFYLESCHGAVKVTDLRPQEESGQLQGLDASPEQVFPHPDAVAVPGQSKFGRSQRTATVL
jgi:hypothetical protein